MNRLERRQKEWMGKKLAAQMAKIDPIKQKLYLDIMETGTKGISQAKTVLKVEGVLGERSGNDAWVEEVIKPETGGTFLKLLGNSYLFPGGVPEESVHGLELVKFALFQLTRQSWFFSLWLVYLFLFRKRKLYWLLFEIDHRTLRHIKIPAKDYCKAAEGVKRAMSLALKQLGIDITRPYYPVNHPRFRPNRVNPDGLDVKTNSLGWILFFVCKFIGTLLELDTAYRFRIQSAFGQLRNVRNILGDFYYKRDINLFFRILDILIKQEASGISSKWKFIKLVARIIFILQPKIKQFTIAVLQNLDIDQVKMTEADWYFSLGYSSFDAHGVSKEQRFAERERLDKLHKHTFFFEQNVVK